MASATRSDGDELARREVHARQHARAPSTMTTSDVGPHCPMVKPLLMAIVGSHMIARMPTAAMSHSITSSSLAFSLPAGSFSAPGRQATESASSNGYS